MLTEPATISSRYRLSPGYHLVPSGDGWLLYRPDGLFARLKVDPELVAAAADLLAGVEPHPTCPPTDELEQLVQALLSEGVISSVADAESSEPTRVTVEGEGPIASRLAELLLDGGLEAHTVQAADGGFPAPSPEGRAPHLIVCCAGWLPDAHFTARDIRCVENGVAWHGVYVEGCRFHLGPFWLPDDPRTVRYADARARRLAADAHADGLEAYWRYLDAGRRVPVPPAPDPAETALVAGALAADILAWAAGRRPPSYGHQLAFDRTSGQWRRHPVLPVPRGLMTEAVP